MGALHDPEYRKAVAALVARRKAAKLTQQALADALGRPQSFVSKFERGERRIDVAEFVRIARVLGMSEAEFLAATGYR